MQLFLVLYSVFVNFNYESHVLLNFYMVLTSIYVNVCKFDEYLLNFVILIE